MATMSGATVPFMPLRGVTYVVAPDARNEYKARVGPARAHPDGGRLWFREGIDVKDVFKEAPWERIPDTQCMTHVYLHVPERYTKHVFFQYTIYMDRME